MVAIAFTVPILTAITFFLIGKLHERIEWNKLIRKGVIPKPVKNSGK